VSEIRNLRRFALFQRRLAEEQEQIALRDVWAFKQEEIASTTLPDDFPGKERLATFFYFTFADLDGADECELTELGFDSGQAREILAAAAS